MPSALLLTLGSIKCNKFHSQLPTQSKRVAQWKGLSTCDSGSHVFDTLSHWHKEWTLVNWNWKVFEVSSIFFKRKLTYNPKSYLARVVTSSEHFSVNFSLSSDCACANLIIILITHQIPKFQRRLWSDELILYRMLKAKMSNKLDYNLIFV